MNEPDEFIKLLEEQSCSGLVAQEFWYHGAPADLVNILFIEVAGATWASCFFDAGVFFWRRAAPDAITGGEPAFEYRLVDVAERLGLRGQRMRRVAFTQPDPGCARLTIAFETGTLILDNTDDRSRLAFVG